ncbi:hypothetical protein GJV85_11790 [Sulfurimonas aquatica]|uniref:TerC family integral membrane protein n=1 Tax=Sulfurimonas aquatica TaxID=2672570 RepID=A0A975B201_9BACT|nr:hypothetical protein [Sulfurimonas aquatica]QSZ42766.1 hypothetical protein GJV85_11790 [Sulfurimonas aquatica]
MYSLGLSLHSVGAIAVLAVIFLNLFLLISTNELKKYKRLMSIFLIPLTLTLFGILVFTGIIMMAAKHLDFTLENIVMIIISLIYMVLEFKRIKSLQHMNETKERAFDAYRPFARRILQVEFILTLLISLWMWLI